MAFTNRIAAALGLLALATPSYAQVSATKEASGNPLWKNLSGSFTLRHYTDVAGQGDKTTSTAPKVQFRPQLATSALDGKLSLTLIGYFDKKPQSTTVEQLQTRGIAEVTAYSAGGFTIAPYLDYRFPHQGSGGTVIPANYASYSKAIESSAGSFSLAAGLDVGAVFSSRKEEVAAVNSSDVKSEDLGARGFTLTATPTGETEVKTAKEDPDLYNDFDFTLSYTPAIAKKVTIAFTEFYKHSHAPQYTVTGEGEKNTKYVRSTTTEDRLRIKYKSSDALSFYNDTYVFHEGVHEARPDGRRLLNITYLAYTLF